MPMCFWDHSEDTSHKALWLAISSGLMVHMTQIGGATGIHHIIVHLKATKGESV